MKMHGLFAIFRRRHIQYFVPGTGITEIQLTVSGEAPGLDSAEFRAAADSAKVNCPLNQALKSVPIKLINA